MCRSYHDGASAPSQCAHSAHWRNSRDARRGLQQHSWPRCVSPYCIWITLLTYSVWICLLLQKCIVWLCINDTSVFSLEPQHWEQQHGGSHVAFNPCRFSENVQWAPQPVCIIMLKLVFLLHASVLASTDRGVSASQLTVITLAHICSGLQSLRFGTSPCQLQPVYR